MDPQDLRPPSSHNPPATQLTPCTVMPEIGLSSLRTIRSIHRHNPARDIPKAIRPLHLTLVLKAILPSTSSPKEATLILFLHKIRGISPMCNTHTLIKHPLNIHLVMEATDIMAMGRDRHFRRAEASLVTLRGSPMVVAVPTHTTARPIECSSNWT